LPRQIASELRASAARLRELAPEAGFVGMGNALRQVAAEFEAEAKGVVAPSLCQMNVAEATAETHSVMAVSRRVSFTRKTLPRPSGPAGSHNCTLTAVATLALAAPEALASLVINAPPATPAAERLKAKRREGNTPALIDHQARKLLGRAEADTVKSERDRAILSTLSRRTETALLYCSSAGASPHWGRRR
jgi:hypothetical protein